MDDMYEFWGQQVRSAREDLGLGQVALARLAGLSQPTISRIELGRGAPSDEAKYRLAYALGRKPRDLFPYLPVPADFAATMQREAVAA